MIPFGAKDRVLPRGEVVDGRHVLDGSQRNGCAGTGIGWEVRRLQRLGLRVGQGRFRGMAAFAEGDQLGEIGLS